MNFFKTKLDLAGKHLSAAVIGGFVAGMATSANAQDSGDGLDSIVGSTSENLANIPNLITAVTYIGGAVLAIGGVLQLKAHVDDPSQPIRKGLVRLVGGGLLLAAPAAFGVITDTLDVSSTEGFDGRGGFETITFDGD